MVVTMIYNFRDKKYNVYISNQYMLAKTLSMFDYEGLPDSIPERELEKIIQEEGVAFIYDLKGELVAFSGSYQGKTDFYGNKSKVVLNDKKNNTPITVNIDEVVEFRNDDYRLGILNLINKYNTLLQENEITILMNNLNNRIHKVFSATDDSTMESIKQYLTKIENGELSVIGESPFLEDLKIQGMNGASNLPLANLIEYHQYLKSSMLNELGIQSNLNNKKERLITAEVEQNKELLYPLVNNMFDNRKKSVEELNNKFNLNVTVEYGSIWIDRNIDKGVETDEIEGLETQNGTKGSTDSDQEVTES